MRKLHFLYILILIFSCEKSENTIEIAISDVLHYKTFFRAENCKSERYENVLIRNETLYVEGIVKGETGNYKRSLTNNEINYLYDLINKIEPNKRSNKEINPTSGMTALIIKRKNKKIDSLVDFTKKWSKTDIELFNYVGKLICYKELEKTKNSTIYPTWEMVKPPK